MIYQYSHGKRIYVVAVTLVKMSHLASKPGTKSIVWDYFGVKKGSNRETVDNGTAIYRSCRKFVITKHRNSWNLLSQLRIHHGKLFAEVTGSMKRGKLPREDFTSTRETQQPTLTLVLEKAQDYERKARDG